MKRQVENGLLVLACIAGCAGPVAVHAPDASARSAGRRWVLTAPVLRDTPSVAASGDDVYVLACAQVSRVEAGRPVWTHAVADGCYGVPGGGPAIAASPLGVIVAAAFSDRGEYGVHVVALDRDGTERWTTDVMGNLDRVALAASADRFAVCAQTRGEERHGRTPPERPAVAGFVATEYDARGKALARVATDPAFTAGGCTYDAHDDLWTVRPQLSREHPLVLAGEAHALAPGTWAVRLSASAPAFVSLGTTPPALVTPQADGFVLTESGSLSFVDLTGELVWSLTELPSGCAVYPTAIAASATRALLEVGYRCDPQGSAQLGDLRIEDREERGEWKPALRRAIVEVDPIARHTRAIHTLPGVPESLAYLETPRGLLAYGMYRGALGLGTGLHSPDEHACTNDAPSDSSRFEMYPTRESSCPDGYRRVSSPHDAPVVALLALH